MKKIFILFFVSFLGLATWAQSLTYKLSYDAVGDKFTVSFVSPSISYPSANIGTGTATVVFSSAYNTTAAAATPIAGGAWAVTEKLTGGGLKYIAFTTGGATLVGGITAGTTYPLFTFTLGSGNNCVGTLRLFVDATDNNDPAGVGSDVTAYLDINGTDILSSNSDATMQSCITLALPVKYSNFTATRKDNDGMLTWTVENQDANSDHFDIERSFNGMDFTAIGTTPVAQTSAATYNYKDAGIITRRGSGMIFYRIKEIDKDNRAVYTETRAIRATTSSYVAIYPNPASAYTNLTIDLDRAQTVYITITDASGKEVQVTHIEGTAGFNMTRLNLSKLSAGNYMINVKIADSTQTLPIVKTQ
jgi:hypothetical protein